MNNIYLVTYEWRRLIGRKKWSAGADCYADLADARHAAECMRGNGDSYRKVTVEAHSVYPAGIHAPGIEKRAARLAKLASIEA